MKDQSIEIEETLRDSGTMTGQFRVTLLRIIQIIHDSLFLWIEINRLAPGIRKNRPLICSEDNGIIASRCHTARASIQFYFTHVRIED